MIKNSIISIIIPCYNEADNIETCYLQLKHQFSKIRQAYECIFVDDGSTDTTLQRIKNISCTDAEVKYISFSRNFGHQKALRAGMKMAKGEAIITMDADLQHPVALLPDIINLWKEGYEVVNTQRIDTTGAKPLKRLSSFIFYKTFVFLTNMNLEKGSADFRLTSRTVTDILCTFNEDDLFLRGIINWCGFQQATISYKAQERNHGASKYTISRMIKLALDGITSFTIRPLRLSILLSAICIILCIIEIGYVCYIILFTEQSVPGWASLTILITILGSMNLLMLGIIGEYIGRIFIQSKQRPLYIIKETNT